MTDIQIETLTNDDFLQLHGLLQQNDNGAMSLEAMDGFLCAVLCCSEEAQPAEYLPHLQGEPEAGKESVIQEEAQALLRRHADSIALQLKHQQPHSILLQSSEAEEMSSMGREWALGFMHGMSLRPDEWKRLAESEENGMSLLPLMKLCEDAEHRFDPEVPLASDEDRQRMVELLPAAIQMMYGYFHPQSAN